MSNEEKKKYLSGYRNACRRVSNLQEELDELRAVEVEAKRQQLSNVPGGSSRKKDLSDVIVKIERLQERIEKEQIKAVDKRLDIENTILNVTDERARKLLHLRYIELKTWESISVQMNCSYRWTLKLHGIALNIFEKN